MEVVAEVMEQEHSGQFPISAIGSRPEREICAVYNNLTTLALRIRSREWSPDNPRSAAAMVSVHVDTVHSSPGGSDNGANVAVAIETARSLVRASNEFNLMQNAVVFMFISGEEDGLMGAHGVVTQHPWFSNVKFVLNLEAMGNGGKQQLFQSTSGIAGVNLLTLWASNTKVPSGTVIATDIFKSGIISSDTDHRCVVAARREI